VLSSCGASVVTAAELADALRAGRVPKRTVVLTFDDGFAGAVREAPPRLDDAGMRATFFCVAGHLGGVSDWPSRQPGAPVDALAGASELADLVRAGHEIGCHGWRHEPLDADADLERELVDSKVALASATGAAIHTFAYPYGAGPSDEALAVVRESYDAAFGTSAQRVRSSSGRWTLPRVDAHYVRDPELLRQVVAGSLDWYLTMRRYGSRARRTFRKDYARQPSARPKAITPSTRE
jgi:peptidoglycan/xylan/chitin deacetylase (PgdA/CDA1 family)